MNCAWPLKEYKPLYLVRTVEVLRALIKAAFCRDQKGLLVARLGKVTKNNFSNVWPSPVCCRQMVEKKTKSDTFNTNLFTKNSRK